MKSNQESRFKIAIEILSPIMIILFSWAIHSKTKRWETKDVKGSVKGKEVYTMHMAFGDSADHSFTLIQWISHFNTCTSYFFWYKNVGRHRLGVTRKWTLVFWEERWPSCLETWTQSLSALCLTHALQGRPFNLHAFFS